MIKVIFNHVNKPNNKLIYYEKDSFPFAGRDTSNDSSCFLQQRRHTAEQSITTEALVSPSASELLCSYVDQNWTFSSVLKTGLTTTADTNFMNTQVQNASLWG